MTSKQKLSVLVFGLGALTVFLFFQFRVSRPATSPRVQLATSLSIATKSSPLNPSQWVDPICAEKIKAVRDYYRREQIKTELAIEQRRYGSNYWDIELGAKDLIQLNVERLAYLQDLNAEMAGAVNAIAGAQPNDSAGLTPIFGPETAGPNLSFLTPDSRDKIETLIAELSEVGPLDPATLLEKARLVLSAEAFITYAQWNAPSSALLRNQLVGYSATEAEFTAIARWADFVNYDSKHATGSTSSALQLEQQLGSPRFAELMRLRTPEIQTAMHDLHRLGLPLDYAQWLSDFRTQITQTLQAVWQDASISPAAKAARVDQLQSAYRTSLIATLSPTGATFDETELLP